MIIIGGTIQYATDNEELLFTQLRQMRADSQAETGCLAYEFSRDLSMPNILHLYEVWESAEALKIHRESTHMTTFKEKVSPSFVDTDIKRYDAKLAV